MPTHLAAAWRAYRRPGRLAALASAVLLVALTAFATAYSSRSSCSEGAVEVACPTDPTGPDGTKVGDQFLFAHQTLAGDGSITARLTSLTGIITYPPPDHDAIVPGLVPWAKAGVIVKDGTAPGTSYAALMMTAEHGVRMQYDYVHDVPGSAAAPDTPRWLRLVRAGDLLTGYESPDGTAWTRVGEARLAGLPPDARIGLFAASPGDITRVAVGLGATIGQDRFTQATAVFDNVTVVGADGRWEAAPVGEMGRTDWEKYHRAPGLTRDGGTLTVTGTGDIGPIGPMGSRAIEGNLPGLAIGLIAVIVSAARFARAGGSRRETLARGAVAGAGAFAAGLAGAGAAIAVGNAVARAHGVDVAPADAVTWVRVLLGAGAIAGLSAVFAYALRLWLRRTWAALSVALPLVVGAYLLGVIPFLPDAASQWLLRATPAAGFAVLQTLREYPYVNAVYLPSHGYLPLPGWAGLAVLCGYTALAGWLALRRIPARAGEPDWR